MSTGSNLRRTVVALFVLQAMALGATDTATPASSPFLSATPKPVSTTAPTGGLEFVAVLGDGKQTNIALYNPQTKKSHWIPVGSTSAGIAVLSYDATRSQVSIRTQGREQRLSLRPERGVAAAAVTINPPFASTAPAKTSASLTPKPAPLNVSPAVSKEQEEARLLVSDLLEIGMEQRKAYEAAQKKATDEAKAVAKPAAR